MRLNRAAARRLREGEAAHGRAHREQSDETVRGLIPSELVPLFERVRLGTCGGTSQSRAEALLRYAERHPEEVFKLVESRAEARIQETRETIADVGRAARGQGVVDYAERRAARIDRLRARAGRLEAAARGAEAQGRYIADAIPAGQPILVGHHSQRRHERDLDRMHRSFRKSVDLADQARELERRANSAERGRAVSSDDPEAIEKLREKLARINTLRERMRAVNAAIRAGGDVAGALKKLGFRDSQIPGMLEKDYAGRAGVPDYALRNRAATAKRLERRIRELEERAATPAPAIFPAIPPEPIRRALKAAGFHWARSAGAWQRHASPGAWQAQVALRGYGGGRPMEGGSP